MKIRARTGRTNARLRMLLVTATVVVAGCRAPDPLLSFLDEESGLSFTHPPRWSVGFAEQDGIRYRYLTAPKVEDDKDALSITLIAPAAATSVDAVAQAYLANGSNVVTTRAAAGSTDWAFTDSTGAASLLRLAQSGDGRFYGAWVRGSQAAMKRYQRHIDTLLASLRFENAAAWAEERFAGMVTRAPSSWTRGSRLSSPTNAAMQFKSLPLAVEKGTATIHGFITLAKEPASGGLDALSKTVKDRASDTVALLEHRPWPGEGDRAAGYVDYMRSGTTLTSTRIRRWITVRNGVGLILSCEARADAFDRLEPWCRRMAETIRLD